MLTTRKRTAERARRNRLTQSSYPHRWGTSDGGRLVWVGENNEAGDIDSSPSPSIAAPLTGISAYMRIVALLRIRQ
jgi:hypothetical protein